MDMPKIDLPSNEVGFEVLKPYAPPVLRFFGAVRDLTMGTGTVVGDSGAHSMPLSDPVLKENIVRVGTHPLGIGLYLFDFKPEAQPFCGAGRRFGVMADEVERVLPAAVQRHELGYKCVNYAMLGIELQ
jgi:hypothetical protein